MTREKMMKGVQYLIRVCCMLVAVVFFALIPTSEAKAGKKDDYCTLQSVTLEINGKEYVCDGSLESIVIPSDMDWETVIKTIKVKDYKVLVNEKCTHEEGHDSLHFYLDGYRYVKCMVHENDEYQYIDMADELGGPYYYLYIRLDDKRYSKLEVIMRKEFKITYNYDAGNFIEGMDVPTSWLGGKSCYLPFMEREGYRFLGWRINDEEELQKNVDLYYYANDCTATAVWEERERISIADCEVSIDDGYTYYGEEIKPWIDYVSISSGDIELYENQDYVVAYENNVEPGDADSENPPTVLVIGVGDYKGIKRVPFTISKGTPWLYYEGAVYVIEGSPLSTIDMSQFKMYGDGGEVAGTIKWEDENRVPQQELGTGMDYEVELIPDDQVHYNVGYYSVYVYVKKSIEDWSVEYKESYQYTGEEIEPAVIVKDGDTILTEGTDYEVSYANNVNSAKSTDDNAPVIIVKGIEKYAGEKRLPFTIEGMDSVVKELPVAQAIEEGQALSASSLSGGKVEDVSGNDLAGVFEWKNKDIVPTIADSNSTKYTVVFKPTDTNYKESESEVTVTVLPKKEVVNPTPNPDPAPNPGPTSPPGQEVKTPKVGSKLKDISGEAYYIVTKVKNGAVEVKYAAPVKKTKNVTIPAKVTLEGKITAKVTAIGNNAFKSNKVVQKVTIGSNVTTIDKNAFYGCSKLNKVTIGKNVTTINEKAFYKCTALTSVTIPSKVKTIGNSAFSGCSKLKKVTIGKNVTSIGKSAFSSCTALTKITIPNKVKTIGEKAFYGNKKMTSVTIGTATTTIGKSCFEKCSGLKTITIKSTKLKTIGKSAFKGINAKATIKVPAKKLDAYTKLLKNKGQKNTVKIKK